MEAQGLLSSNRAASTRVDSTYDFRGKSDVQISHKHYSVVYA
jgi:hypothetical protein